MLMKTISLAFRSAELFCSSAPTSGLALLSTNLSHVQYGCLYFIQFWNHNFIQSLGQSYENIQSFLWKCYIK